MPTPSKPIQLVKGHVTKKQIKAREKAESSLASGSSFKEWAETKNNPVAHKEFMRLRKVLAAIKKNDALHESIINRYCLLHAECKEYEAMLNDFLEQLKCDELLEMKFEDRIMVQLKIQDKIMQCDSKLMQKRKMMLDIEKENIMTIASVLRSIPKNPEEEKKQSKMAEFLRNRG